MRFAGAAWFLVLSLAGTSGCGGGGSPPTLSDLVLGQSTVAPGAQLSGSVQVRDPDGLEGLKVTLHLTGTGTVPTDQTVPVQGATSSLQDALVPFSILISPAAPAGDYTLGLTALDGDGNQSNEVTAALSVK